MFLEGANAAAKQLASLDLGETKAFADAADICRRQRFGFS
jgi:hypothetical protein